MLICKPGYINWIFRVAVVLGVCAIPYVYYAGSGAFSEHIGMLYVLMAALAVLGLYALYGMFCGKNDKPHISVTDILVAVYFGYGLINMAAVGDKGLDRVVLIRWSAVLAVYMLFRLLDDRRPVILGLIVLGVMQSSHAYMQLAGISASHHFYFEVTGMFGNPGQLAGLLCVSAVAVCGMVTEAETWRNKTLWLLVLAYVSGALLAADSRAGWMALVVGGAYVIYSNTKLKGIIPGKAAVLSLCVVACLVLVFLYSYRPDSADGRLLIWRVSADMIADRPFFGHGAGSLLSEYMNYQGEYFCSHPDSAFARFAGNITCVYNEFLHIWIEQGLVGLLLLAGLLSSALLGRATDVYNRLMRGILLALLVYSCFSYPASVFPLLVLFAAAVGSIRSEAIFRVLSPRTLYSMVFLIVCASFVISVGMLRFYKYANDFRVGQNAKVIYPLLNNDVRFMDVYSLHVMDDPDKLWVRHVLEDAARITPTSGLMCDLGLNYMADGMYDKAEGCFVRAEYMVPARIYPLYCRFMLARQKGDIEGARVLARRIVSHEVKAESTRSLRIRAEAIDFLSQGSLE